jgi:hypothetical protein
LPSRLSAPNAEPKLSAEAAARANPMTMFQGSMVLLGLGLLAIVVIGFIKGDKVRPDDAPERFPGGGPGGDFQIDPLSTSSYATRPETGQYWPPSRSGPKRSPTVMSKRGTSGRFPLTAVRFQGELPGRESSRRGNHG